MSKAAIDRINNLLQAHEELVVALDDWLNMPLNSAAAERLKKAKTKSSDLIGEDVDG